MHIVVVLVFALAVLLALDAVYPREGGRKTYLPKGAISAGSRGGWYVTHTDGTRGVIEFHR